MDQKAKHRSMQVANMTRKGCPRQARNGSTPGRKTFSTSSKNSTPTGNCSWRASQRRSKAKDARIRRTPAGAEAGPPTATTP
eukprot:14351828-Heterocapsa_arctica.AAC.1